VESLYNDRIQERTCTVETHPSPSHWDRFQHLLRSRVSDTAWTTWIEPLAGTFDGAALHLEAPSEFHRRWVNDRFRDTIEEAAAAVFGDGVEVTLDIGEGAPSLPDLDRTHADPAVGAAVGPDAPKPDLPVSPAVQDFDSRLIAKYTFENFVVGQSNRFAHAAAMAVGEQPGSHYNPLFVYGGAGLGKTHLLHAVGHHRRELAPGSVVRYVSSEQFFNEFINGIRRKRMDEFKARYRTIDVLLLDDVQFFEGKEQILEEFFHTFNSLYEAGKQLVISADRPPKHLSTLEDRLRSRFEWGLTTDIQPPDVETRLAILRKNAEFAPTPVPRDVLGFIAENVLDNIRELEGALTRVTAYAALTHEKITLQMAHEVLQDIVPPAEARTLTVPMILSTVATHYGLTVDDLIGPSRKQPLALHRQIAMYLCRDLTDLSLPKIGAAFGGRDHTTVIHAVEKVKKLIQSDKQIFDEVTRLTQTLRKT
jgi:chromosomal replication initiator protein